MTVEGSIQTLEVTIRTMVFNDKCYNEKGCRHTLQMGRKSEVRQAFSCTLLTGLQYVVKELEQV